MIYISTTASNTVTTTTLQNRISLANDYFTWKIINRNNFEQFVFAPLVSTQSSYYCQFTFSVATPSVATGSIISFDLPYGEYHYEIYQTTSQYDLNLTTSLGIVETGLIKVPGIASTFSSFTASDLSTIKVFEEL